MWSTPSWVNVLVDTKHEGVAKILERVERKWTCTVRYEFEDSFVVPADLPSAFRQKTKSSSFPAKNGNHTEWAALRVVVVSAWTKHQRVFGEFPPILVQNHLKSKTELSWSDWKDQVPIPESEVLPAAVADRQDESSSSSDTSSSSSTESNT